MLGAQARAAELQAAKSAAMRQKAHYEVEDPTLPPDSAPVSLNDFVRNPPPNKNKGTKAFRPIIDSDFEISGALNDQQTSSSSTPSVDNVITRVPESAPIAPRAMLLRSISSTSKITSSRATVSTFTPRGVYPGSLQRALGFYDSPRSTLSLPTTTCNAAGHIFGPDDISPTKQESKFAELRQRDDAYRTMRTTDLPFHTAFMPNDGACLPLQEYHYDTNGQHAQMLAQVSYDPYTHDQPASHHYPSEYRTSTVGYDPGQSQAERIQVFANDVLDHQNRMQRDLNVRESLKTTPPVLGIDLPYDRHSKMQSFVAAQQAMARKGKTVLHNPELHRSPVATNVITPRLHALTTITPSPFQTHTNLSFLDHEEALESPDTRRSTKIEDKEAIMRAMLKRDAARMEPQIEHTTSEEQGTANQVSNDDVHTTSRNLTTKVYPDDWCFLKSISDEEKEFMLRRMRNVATEPTTEPDIPRISISTSLTGQDAQEWLRTQSLHPSKRRTDVARLVDEHEKRRDHISTYGVIGKPIFREQSDLSTRGTLKIVATIMATLYDCADDRRTNSKSSEYTLAPRYAIDEMAGMNLTGASLFDDLGFRVAKFASKTYK